MIKRCLTRSITMIFLPMLLILILTTSAMALDVTASSCSVADIQAAIDNVVSNGGGTVYVPAGNCTWTSSVSVDTGSGRDIRIIGAGQSVTTIIDFRLSIPSGGTNIIELAHMTIGGSSLNQDIFSEKFRPKDNAGSKELNFHHLTISGRGPLGNIEGWIGVVHHNTFTCRSGQYGWYVHGYGNYDTNEPPTMGTRSMIFFEDNIFDGCYHSVSGFCNSKMVFRYNTIRNSTHCVDVHGPSYNGCYYSDPQWNEDGGRLLEHYNNIYESSNACGAKIRSGTGISKNNDYQFTTSTMSYFGLKIDSGSGSGGCGDFSHRYTYPCSNGVCQGPMSFWIWEETCPGGNCFDASYDSCDGGIRENIEYFLRSPSQGQDGFTYTPYAYPHPLTDPNAPTVQITQPTSNSTYTTTDASINLSGTATDPGGTNTGITSVTWSNNTTGGSGNCTISGSGNSYTWDCGAIPENLMESELFGHERGAFTGAHIQRAGRIELAKGGTLFLDEIGELPFSLQVKLLRFLQDHKIERVGGREAIEVDVRIIAATNKDVKKLVSDGLFREDLYYRLAVVTIDLPSLRERGEDIILLAKAFLQRFADIRKGAKSLSDEAIDALNIYEWPGNVRELENKIRRAIALAEGYVITASDLGFEAVVRASSGELPFTPTLNLKKAKEELEKKIINAALVKHNGNISKAAEELGLTRPTLHHLLKRYNITKK